MLISEIVSAVGQLLAIGLPVLDATTGAARPVAHSVTPGEPSTIVEALIGTALIAGYLGVVRRVRGPRRVTTTSMPPQTGSGRKAA